MPNFLIHWRALRKHVVSTSRVDKKQRAQVVLAWTTLQ